MAVIHVAKAGFRRRGHVLASAIIPSVVVALLFDLSVLVGE
jgi:hypothetical protein